MAKFGRTSTRRLDTCDIRLQRIFTVVVKHFDCSVLCGHRNKADQNKAFDEGRSKLRYPDGKHNTYPSKAVDVAPYYSGEGIPWDDKERFILFAGFVLGVATQMGINIRWGGDWKSDKKMNNKFFDGPHFEIVD